MRRSSSNTGGVGQAAKRNVISGNLFDGVEIADSGTQFNVVAANYIGVDVTGEAALGNTNNAVAIFNGAQSNRIGTDADGVADAAEHALVGPRRAGRQLGRDVRHVQLWRLFRLRPGGARRVDVLRRRLRPARRAWNCRRGSCLVVAGRRLRGLAALARARDAAAVAAVRKKDGTALADLASEPASPELAAKARAAYLAALRL